MAPSGPRRRDDNEAPWLAEVESDGDGSTSVARGRFIGGITLFVLLLLLVVIGIYVIASTKQDGATGTPVARAEDAPLITADAGAYKLRPESVGGMQVDGAGESIYGIGEGNDNPGVFTSTPAEEPGPRPGEAPVALLPSEALPAIPPPAAAVAPPALVVAPPPVRTAPVAPPPGNATVAVTTAPPAAAVRNAPAPAVAETGTVVQLGAFSTVGKAEQAWKSLSTRFAYLAPLTKRIEAVETASGRLYRLRATGSADNAAAVQVCSRLRIAGENCLVLK